MTLVGLRSKTSLVYSLWLAHRGLKARATAVPRFTQDHSIKSRNKIQTSFLNLSLELTDPKYIYLFFLQL